MDMYDLFAQPCPDYFGVLFFCTMFNCLLLVADTFFSILMTWQMLKQES